MTGLLVDHCKKFVKLNASLNFVLVSSKTGRYILDGLEVMAVEGVEP